MLRDTILTEREVSLWNFDANIVVIAATGAEQEIKEETSISPRILHKNIIPNAIRGNTKSLRAMAKRHLIFFMPSEILLPAKWKPIIIIGSGVLSDAI